MADSHFWLSLTFHIFDYSVSSDCIFSTYKAESSEIHHVAMADITVSTDTNKTNIKLPINYYIDLHFVPGMV